MPSNVDRKTQNVHNQPIKNHFSIATRLEASRVRYSEIVRNGYAKQSFKADSAARSSLREFGTFFTANLPVRIDVARIYFHVS